MSGGSSPFTKYGLYPYPTNRSISSSCGMRASTVGPAILYPVRCSTRKTTPSRVGFKNLFECQLVASAPVSASPSPTTQQTSRSGLSNAAPYACSIEYPSSPPLLIEPGVSGDAWLGIPPGQENCWNSICTPAASCVILGYNPVYEPSRYVFATIPGPPCPGPVT